MSERMIWFAYSKRKFLMHKLKSLGYRLILRHDNAKKSRGLLGAITKKAFSRVILIFAIVTVVFMLDDLLSKIIDDSAELQQTLSFVSFPLDLGLSIGIITTGIGVAGVFLALYSANINSIYTAKYANAPETIARLFEHDIVSNKSISQISNYLLFSSILVCFCIASKRIGLLSLIVFLLYTIILITSFGLLGNKRHRLSDTYGIASSPLNEIVNLTEKATSKGPFSSDINFQAHYQKVCSKNVSALREIADFNISGNENRNDAMVDFAYLNNSVLATYWKKKNCIRFSSKWYCDKEKYKKWHLASDYEIHLALQTGTTLSRETESDYYWLEDSLLEVNNSVLSELINAKDWKNLYLFCMRLNELAEAAVLGNATKYFLEYAETITMRIADLLLTEIDEEKHELGTLMPNIVDALCMIPTSIVISINKYLNEISWSQYLSDMLSASKYESINLSKNPFANNWKIEKLFCGIATEILIDGRRITPNWYVEQTLACCILERIEEMVATLDRAVNICSVILGEKLLERKLSLEAMIVFSRATETKTKTRASCEILDELLPFLKKKCLDNTGVFSDSSYDLFLDNMQRFSKTLPAYWVKCAEFFTVDHWNDMEKYPDILGQCYNNLCNYLINALAEVDLESFTAVYPSFLRITLIYQEYVRKDLVDRPDAHLQDAILSAISKPIVEFSTISGYSYLWGELIDPEWKEIVLKGIREFQPNSESTEEFYTRWVVMCNFYDNRFPAMYNRDIIQSEWDLKIERVIRERELLKYKHNDPFFSEEIETDSNLIRAFLGNTPDIIFYSGAHEVFLVECINEYLPEEKKYKSDMKWEKGLDNDQ